MNRKTSKTLSLLALASIASTNISVAASNFQYQPGSPQPQYQGGYYPEARQTYGAQQPLKGRIVTVPPGVQLAAVVSTPISSEYLTLGQPVSVTLGSDFYYNSTLIAPAGSTVMGTVTQVKKAKLGSMNGELKLRFTEITTPYGLRVPISAIVKTDDLTGVLRGGTKMDVAKNYAKDAAAGAALGALGGLLGAAVSGGAVGKGAALGTAIGAGGGVVKSVIDKGQNVEIPANSTIQLVIDQPITVNPSGYSYDY